MWGTIRQLGRPTCGSSIGIGDFQSRRPEDPIAQGVGQGDLIDDWAARRIDGKEIQAQSTPTQYTLNPHWSSTILRAPPPNQ